LAVVLSIRGGALVAVVADDGGEEEDSGSIKKRVKTDGDEVSFVEKFLINQ
jgi:hypothetical protein